MAKNITHNPPRVMGYIFDENISGPENGGTLELWNFHF
jgi:hypothetical protein